MVTQQPDPYGRRLPYNGEWSRPEESTQPGYPPPYVRPTNGPTYGPADGPGSRGTVYGSAAPQYGSPEFHRSGADRPNIGYPDSGYPGPEQPRRKRGVIVAGIVVVLLLGAGGVAAYEWYGTGSPGVRSVAAAASSTANPSPIPGASGASGATQAASGAAGPATDPGVAMCKLLRDTKPSAGSGSGSGTGTPKLNDAQVQYMRKQFASSRYADLRQAGAEFLDLTTMRLPTPTGTDIVAIMRQALAKVMTAFTDLSKACANHGVKLPPITAQSYVPSPLPR